MIKGGKKALLFIMVPYSEWQLILFKCGWKGSWLHNMLQNRTSFFTLSWSWKFESVGIKEFWLPRKEYNLEFINSIQNQPILQTPFVDIILVVESWNVSLASEVLEASHTLLLTSARPTSTQSVSAFKSECIYSYMQHTSNC